MNMSLPSLLQPVGRPMNGVLGDLLPPASTAAASVPELWLSDWNDLLDAVKQRLRQSVQESVQGHHLSPPGSPLERTGACVVECVAALDQLHSSVRQELGRRQRLELELFELKAALASARAELAGTQAGERHARQLATHDALTALPNRSLFGERLERALGLHTAAQAEVSVLYIDLDDFKPINDAHGHAVGDEVLRIVAMRLQRAVRSDDLVSRLGGDEFACLVADPLDRAQLKRLACKLFDAISAPLAVGELRLCVTPSIGIATHSGGPGQPERLLQRADAAMYRAKRERCGVAFCDGEIPATATPGGQAG